jgi:hypothetical protein
MRPAQRVWSNEARFAAANDEIALFAGTLAPREFVPFLCECQSTRCTELAELSLGEYEALRLFANRFLVAPACSSAELPDSLVLERNERYTVVDRPSD